MLEWLKIGAEADFEVVDGGEHAGAKPRFERREGRDGLEFHAHWTRGRGGSAVAAWGRRRGPSLRGLGHSDTAKAKWLTWDERMGA